MPTYVLSLLFFPPLCYPPLISSCSPTSFSPSVNPSLHPSLFFLSFPLSLLTSLLFSPPCYPPLASSSLLLIPPCILYPFFLSLFPFLPSSRILLLSSPLFLPPLPPCRTVLISLTSVVVLVISTDWISWDNLNRGFLPSDEVSRAFLASFILVFDLLIVMQVGR